MVSLKNKVGGHMKRSILVFLVLSGFALTSCAGAESMDTSSYQTYGAPSSEKEQAAPAPANSGKYNFGNFTSEVLASKAWDALKANDHEAVEAYTKKCIDLYERKALEQVASLSGFAPKENAFNYWALNDVAVCYYIKAQSLLAQGKTDEAKQDLQFIIDKLQYAQAWDPKGWFWKVAEGAKDKLDTLGTSYDFGDYTSSTLTSKAWEALNSADYKGVELYTNKCISLFEKEASKQQAGLTDFAPKEKAFDNWALNDVATAYLIRGQANLAQGKIEEGKKDLNIIVENFSYAQAWDPKGWFWKVASAAKDKLDTLGTAYDFGDYTSQTLVTKAWEAFNVADYKGVGIYTKKCIELYEADAKKQQAGLTDFAPKEKAFDNWALNDVATAYYILGQANLAEGKIDEAKQDFNTIIEGLSFAQCWDPRGWFWKVADGANDKLSTIGTSYDFGDYTSSTLTGKAWESLNSSDHKGVEIYTKKCIDLYEVEAKKQQAGLKEFAPKDKAFDNWALNDVGTCYFILGESLMAQKRYKEAKAAYERVVNDFSYAQCWDPQGWFWKVAVGARGKINKIIVLGQ
jgi:hypothetical protein